jgi:hypothetical protein
MCKSQTGVLLVMTAAAGYIAPTRTAQNTSSNVPYTVACLHSCYLAIGLHVTVTYGGMQETVPTKRIWNTYLR